MAKFKMQVGQIFPFGNMAETIIEVGNLMVTTSKVVSGKIEKRHLAKNNLQEIFNRLNEIDMNLYVVNLLKQRIEDVKESKVAAFFYSEDKKESCFFLSKEIEDMILVQLEHELLNAEDELKVIQKDFDNEYGSNPIIAQ